MFKSPLMFVIGSIKDIINVAYNAADMSKTLR